MIMQTALSDQRLQERVEIKQKKRQEEKNSICLYPVNKRKPN